MPRIPRSIEAKSYSAGHFLFHLDDKRDVGAAYLKSVGGGMYKSAVLEEQAGPVAAQFKHLGTIELDPITIEIGMALSRPILEWIQLSWKRQFVRKDGQITHADFNFHSRIEQHFYQALITETKSPTLDGAARDPAYLSVTIMPEEVKVIPGDGNVVQGVTGLNQKLWLPSNFELTIDGISAETTRYVNRIDSFAVTQRIRPLYYGRTRSPQIEPVGIDFSNIVSYIAVEHAQGFLDWYQQSVVEGQRDTADTKTGSIAFLGPDNATPIFYIDLTGVGIHRLTIEKAEAQAESIKRAKVEFYVESMELRFIDKYIG